MNSSENTRYSGVEVSKRVLVNTPVVSRNTASAITYTANEFQSGLILRDPNGAGRTDITPTAASLYQTFSKPQRNSAFRLVIRNTADAAETITIQGGSGVTISGTATIAQNNSREFLVVFTSPTTVVMYSLGTSVH